MGSSKAFHVIMGSRSLERAKQAIERLHTECPEATNTVDAIQLDVTSDESIENAFETIKTGHGRLDTLVNNAGRHITRELRTLFSVGGTLISSRRCSLRWRIRLWQGFASRLLQQSLRCERRRHKCHDMDVHPAFAEISGSAANLRGRSFPNHGSCSAILPHATATCRVAQTDRL